VLQNPFSQISGAKMTVFEEVACGLENLGVPRDEMASRIEDVLKMFGLWEKRNENPFELSGGQLQRLTIASVLALKPEIVIFDEPTSQLDPQATNEVFDAIGKLKKNGITIVIVEHKFDKLVEYTDRIMLLHEGKLLYFDSPEKIFSKPEIYKLQIGEPFHTYVCKKLDVKTKEGYYPAKFHEAVSLLRTVKEKCDKFNQRLESVMSNVPLTDVAEFEKVKAQNSMLENYTQLIESSEREDQVIRVENLWFYYKAGEYVLENINVVIDKRATAIVGENGAGKTTFVKLIKALLKPVKGEIFVKDQNTKEATVAQLSKVVGLVFQNPADQIFKSKVTDEVMFGPLNVFKDRSYSYQKSLEALRIVGLDNKVNYHPYDLTLSERKLLCIASILAMDPEIIIFDEPTIAQDRYHIEKIGEIIKELIKNRKAVITITHDMDFVYNNFERTIVFSKGKIIYDGLTKIVLNDEKVLSLAHIELPTSIKLLRYLR
ncbi:MAG: ABC transporter ATP-binding protein, partial [Fervidobacterium sp.]